MPDPTPPSPTQHPPGLDERDEEINEVRHRLNASEFQLEGCIRDLGAARAEVERLLADLGAAREELRRVRVERDALKVKLDRPCGECHPCTEWAAETWKQAGLPLPHLVTWQDMVAERDRMRPVVEAARTWRWRSATHPTTPYLDATRLEAAVDTYETQESTDAG